MEGALGEGKRRSERPALEADLGRFPLDYRSLYLDDANRFRDA